MEFIEYIVSLGPAVLLPVVIFIIGVILRQKISKSLYAGITMGVGFVGIGLIVNLLTDKLGSAAKAMAHNFGLGLSVVDIGWLGTAPMAWASNLGLLAIPIAIAVNVVMLLLRMTRVVNIDIWNIWHMAFTGSIVAIATGNFWWGVAGVVIHAVIAYKLGDMFAQVTDKYFGLEGIAIPHGTSAYMGVFAVPIDDVLNKIPGIRTIKITSEHIEKKLGVFGQPAIVGAFLGFIIGLLARYPVGQSLELAIQMAAVMLLMPVVVKFIMEGLTPISEAAKKILDKHFKGADYRVGLDPALLLGNTQVIAASLVFIPLTLLIAMVMPGNRVLPFGDLATVGFFVAMAVGVHHGNIFRTLISGSVIIGITLWISNQMIDLQTQLARNTDLLQTEKVASLDQGGSPITYLLAHGISAEVGFGFIMIFILFAGAFAYTFAKYKRKLMFVENGKEMTGQNESLSSHSQRAA